MHTACFNLFLLAQLALAYDGSHRYSNEDCNLNFNVWQPDTDMVQRMQILEMKFANFSASVDVQVLKIRFKLQTDIFKLYNISSDLSKGILSRTVENAKMMTELAGINRRIGEYEKTLDVLGDSVNTVVLQKSVRRSVRRKHPRTGHISSTEKPVAVEALNHKVTDLSAEWILMKREIIELQRKLKRVEEEHRELSNATGQVRIADGQRHGSVVTGRDRNMGRDLQVDVEGLQQEVARMLKKQGELEHSVASVKNDVGTIHSKLAEVRQDLRVLHPGSSSHRPMADHQAHHTGVPKDCDDIVAMGYRTSGVYKIKPSMDRPIDDIYCEIVGDVGYTVVQRRTDGLQTFNRGWLEYKVGFGSLYGEFWAGNDFLHSLSKDNRYFLRVDLWDWEGNRTYAEYDDFSVSDEKGKFSLSVGGYHGTAGDSLGNHNGMAFSTPDRDNDRHKRNCAADNKGGWWFNSCYFSQLNGIYHVGWYSQSESPFADGVVWEKVKNSVRYSLRRAEMKLRLKK